VVSFGVIKFEIGKGWGDRCKIEILIHSPLPRKVSAQKRYCSVVIVCGCVFARC
jgi:hypothetical protein